MLTTELTPAAQFVISTAQDVNADYNDVLLGYQKKWIADDSPLKIAEKSRRTGLTWAEAADASLTTAKSREAGGTNHFYIGSNKEMAREFIDAAAMWAKAYGLAAGEVGEEVFEDEDKDILTFVIYFASGFKVQALSSNPKNLRGMQGNVTIDEAGHHERLAEVLKAALALTMWGAKIRIISTHNGVENLFNELIQDSRAGRKRYSIHTITLDDACNDGLYRRICQISKQDWSQAKEDEWKANLLKDTATEEDALEEYYCVPKQGSGAYIPRVLIDRATREEHPVLRFTMPDGHMEWTEEERHQTVATWCEEDLAPLLTLLDPDIRHSVGGDFARIADLSIFSVSSIEQDTRRRLRLTVELRSVPYNQQREIIFFILHGTPRLVGVALDAGGNGGYLAEAVLLHWGEDMVAAIQLSESWYREWAPKYKALFESGYIEIPKDEDIITDQRHLQVIRGVPKIDKNRSTGADGNKRHGDSCVSYMMAIRASYMDGQIIEFTPLPGKHSVASEDDDSPNIERGCW